MTDKGEFTCNNINVFTVQTIDYNCNITVDQDSGYIDTHIILMYFHEFSPPESLYQIHVYFVGNK